MEDPLVIIYLIPSCYERGSWGPERWWNLPKATQQSQDSNSSLSDAQSQGFFFLSVYPLTQIEKAILGRLRLEEGRWGREGERSWLLSAFRQRKPRANLPTGCANQVFKLEISAQVGLAPWALLALSVPSNQSWVGEFIEDLWFLWPRERTSHVSGEFQNPGVRAGLHNLLKRNRKLCFLDEGTFFKFPEGSGWLRGLMWGC